MVKDFKFLLKEKGLKVTKTRLDILNVFSDKCSPINALYIKKTLKNKKVNLVTIYRNLVSFENSSILKRVDLHQESLHYELVDNYHHHHIICLKCKNVKNFDDCNIDSSLLIKKILRQNKEFEMISYHSFDLFGICKKCINSKSIS